jgi:hypothetical protein
LSGGFIEEMQDAARQPVDATGEGAGREADVAAGGRVFQRDGRRGRFRQMLAR